jgi:hypothetical protein
VAFHVNVFNVELRPGQALNGEDNLFNVELRPGQALNGEDDPHSRWAMMTTTNVTLAQILPPRTR